MTPRRVVTDHDIYAYNEATVLYRDEEITAREYLARTRHVWLAIVDEVLLESVRSTLTLERARELGLVG